MNALLRRPTRNSGLDDVIEPLADFICAADRPSAALKSALATLTHRIEQTNSLARARIARFGGPRAD